MRLWLLALVCLAGCEPEVFISEVTRLNHPPAPGHDSYIGAADTDLVIDAGAGVLANDSDPDGDPLSARLDTAPLAGTVDLAADGSFTYVPSAGFTGSGSLPSPCANRGAAPRIIAGLSWHG